MTAIFEETTCRVCGCTDEDCRECYRRTGQPCRWVEDDLCSACYGDMTEGGCSGRSSGLHVPA